MTVHSEVLWDLAAELLDSVSLGKLRGLTSSQPVSYDKLVEFDCYLGGPGMSNINQNGVGRYHIADRDVFRPLQYCVMYFDIGFRRGNLEWLSRDIVQMSSLHIEGLVKRVGRVFHLPLGTALRKAVVERKVDPVTWDRIARFTKVYNDAKHNVRHPKDTHLFSIQDAIIAYVVCRKLGMSLYHLAGLRTDLTVFGKDCGC